MDIKYLAVIIGHAAKDSEGNLQILKTELKNNGYKLCGMGVELMLGQMSDMGLADDAVAYWKTLGLTHLPYEPANALKE